MLIAVDLQLVLWGARIVIAIWPYIKNTSGLYILNQRGRARMESLIVLGGK